MDLKKEVRRRIEELTRLAYERGYRDGAQSALAEIEKAAGEDLAERLKESPASLPALAKTAAPDARRPAPVNKRKVQQRKAKPDGAAPKAVTVQRCIQRLIASKGEARRDEVLATARTENPKITSQDVLNGIRTLTQRAEIRVDPEDKSRLLPSEPRREQTPAG
jgi:flagellar biosynthesis/type III secretory pathway protein FliH